MRSGSIEPRFRKVQWTKMDSSRGESRDVVEKVWGRTSDRNPTQLGQIEGCKGEIKGKRGKKRLFISRRRFEWGIGVTITTLSRHCERNAGGGNRKGDWQTQI